MIVSFEICIMFEVIKDVPEVDILCVVSVVVESIGIHVLVICNARMRIHISTHDTNNKNTKYVGI